MPALLQDGLYKLNPSCGYWYNGGLSQYRNKPLLMIKPGGFYAANNDTLLSCITKHSCLNNTDLQNHPFSTTTVLQTSTNQQEAVAHAS